MTMKPDRILLWTLLVALPGGWALLLFGKASGDRIFQVVGWITLGFGAVLALLPLLVLILYWASRGARDVAVKFLRKGQAGGR